MSLLKGVKGAVGQDMPRGEVIKAVYNALMAPYRKITGTKNGQPVYEANDTLGVEKFKLYEEEGVVVSTPNGTITSGIQKKDDRIVVDGVQYKVNLTDIDKYLGTKVTFYYIDSTSDVPEVIAIVSSGKSEEVTIDADDIDKMSVYGTNGETAGTLTAFTSKKSNTTKKYNVSGATVIYNGSVLTAADYSASGNTESYDDFIIPEVGTVKIVDYDADGVYDIVFVDSYETMLVTTAANTGVYVFGGYKVSAGESKADYYGKEDSKYRYNALEDEPEKFLELVKPGDVFHLGASGSTIYSMVKMADAEDVAKMASSGENIPGPSYSNESTTRDIWYRGFISYVDTFDILFVVVCADPNDPVEYYNESFDNWTVEKLVTMDVSDSTNTKYTNWTFGVAGRDGGNANTFIEVTKSGDRTCIGSKAEYGSNKRNPYAILNGVPSASAIKNNLVVKFDINFETIDNFITLSDGDASVANIKIDPSLGNLSVNEWYTVTVAISSNSMDITIKNSSNETAYYMTTEKKLDRISRIDFMYDKAVDGLKSISLADYKDDSFAVIDLADSETPIMYDLYLPTAVATNITQTWSIEGDAVYTINGETASINLSDKNTHKISLVRTIEYKKDGNVIESKTVKYPITVQYNEDAAKAMADKLAAASENKYTADQLIGNLLSKYQVRFDDAYAETFSGIPTSTTSNITLPTAGYFGSVITWTSNAPTVISNSGVVKRPSSTRTVTMTATIMSGSSSVSKNFEISVSGSSSSSGGGGSV